MDYSQNFKFSNSKLPTELPTPHVTMPRESLIRFKDQYDFLGKWVAEICGVEFKNLCAADMMVFQKKIAQILKTCEAAMIYAYEDRNDQYYLNVLENVKNVRAGFVHVPVEDQCAHVPVAELSETVQSQTIFPGKVGFSFFGPESWFCQKCGSQLIAKWLPAKPDRRPS